MKRDIIIIGGGVGGLATAARLLAKGYRVKIIEKDKNLGGKTNIISNSIFSFDMTASISMMIENYIEVFNDINKDYKDYIELIPLNPIYKVFYGKNKSFEISSNLSNLTYGLENFSKDDSLGYMKFLSDTYEKYLISDKYFLKRPQNKLFQFLNAKNIYEILKINPFINSNNYIKRYINNDILREFLIFQSMYVGVSPYNSSSIYTLVPAISNLHGLYHIKGGMYSFIEALEQIITEFGGNIEKDKEVDEILIEDGKAVGVKVSGEKYYSDIVVCNADFSYAINNLIKEPIYKSKYSDNKIESLKYSCSTFILHLGLSKKYNTLDVHNIIIGKNFRDNIEAPFIGKLPIDPSYYIYYPSKVDDSLCLKNNGCMNITLRVPNLLKNKKIVWSSGLIKVIRNKIINDLSKIDGLKNIKNEIVFEKYTTPITLKDRFNSYGGCAFGLSHSLDQTNYFRPQAKYKDVKNLYFVGASVHPGTGVSMVLTSSKLCVEEIIKNS